MRRIAGLALSALLGVPALAQWHYPPTKTVEAADTYFVKTYKDPYRWLENLKDPEVETWFKAQADLTDGLLAAIPGRDVLAQEWTELDKLTPARFSSITCKHGRMFYKKTQGGESIGRLYVREGWTGKEKLLFDPSTYKAGVKTVIQSMVPSFDGKHVALGLSANGAEVSEIRVLAVGTGTLLPDRIDSSYGPMGWTPNSTSFFYDAGPATDPQTVEFHLNRKARMHRLGTPLAKDQDVFSSESHPELGLSDKETPTATVDESCPGTLLASAATAQQELRMFCAPASQLKGPKIAWRVLCKPSDNLVESLVFDKDRVYAVTHTGAPRFKVVRTRLAKPDWDHAETVVPEGPDSIRYITRSRSFLYVVYSNGITGRILKRHLATGRSSEVPLPASGSVDLSCPDAHSDRCLLTITSWTSPATRYDFDAATGVLAKSVFNSDVVYPGFKNLVAEEVEVPGQDGTLIPLSIIHLKDMPLDGSSSCILEGYGSYGYSLTPHFSIQNSVVSRGVVRAFAHVRGGGEKGEAWHLGGFKATKPNTWKDFISCAEYLVKKGYTSPRKLAGTGTSAGGILISRAITERPDLFAAAVCNVGDADAMRCEFGTDGPSNAMEYGTVKDPVECAALYEMDGVQHVRTGVGYPAVMGVGGWNDPRVAPWQPGKFVAALQNASSSGSPLLMKINYDSGHFTEDKGVMFKNFAGQYAFMLWQTGHKDFQPAK